jgi:uncharacterized protein YeaO (DUF488 family)
MSPEVTVRRVYDDLPPRRETRVLVDRVWPRGIRKEALHLDEWVRDVAPSTELRKWYGHDPEKFSEFRRLYIAELAQPGPQAGLGRLRTQAAEGPVALLTATRDVDRSNATVLGGDSVPGLPVGEPPTAPAGQSIGKLARTSKAGGPGGG